MRKYISYNKFIRNTLLISLISVIVLFIIYSKYIQSSSIEKSIEDDTKVMSDLVFQNLYTVMKNGGNIEDINNTILNLEKNIPHVNIKIIKDITDTNKKIVNDVFLNKTNDVVRHNDHLDFATPIIYKNECLKCHTNAKVDDVAAVTLIQHPILDLKISLKELLTMITILFILIIIVFFTSWYYFLNKYFNKPIKDLVTQIDATSNHHDLKNNIIINTPIKEIKHLESVYNKQNKELFDSYKSLEEQSVTDSLTGVFNRKKFDEYCNFLMNNAKRYNDIFSLVVIDLNKFKPINDTYGHDIGDEVLIFFSQIISQQIRKNDLFFRTGGDEFILLLPKANLEESTKIVDKLKNKFKKTHFKSKDLEFEIYASYGIAQYDSTMEDITQLVKMADQKMYEDKKKYARD